jgi:pimeloyl-ACP methyl ester carboxylesterase
MTAGRTITAAVTGQEHWTRKGDIRLFLWEKSAGAPRGDAGTVLFVHGSSMASQPTFDLQVLGRPSAMDHFAGLGYDTWCVDMEGYGRSDKHRDINADIATGADDVAAAAEYIASTRGVGSVLVYGISSGALRAALFAQRHPERVRRLALDAFVWTGEGSPTLAERRKRLPEFQAKNRRPIDRAFVHSIFTRDHPGTADPAVVDAFAQAILSLDDSVPTGTYCAVREVGDSSERTAQSAGRVREGHRVPPHGGRAAVGPAPLGRARGEGRALAVFLCKRGGLPRERSGAGAW